ncbi:hypothetical protein SESBI_48633 [Sesbania bispinosa]|nr:hypothetical protein SESBI_48633 [Sesbania bispinosa]
MEAARALARVIHEKGGNLCVANTPLMRLAQSHATAMVFRVDGIESFGFCHNKPLYVEAVIEGMKIRCALVDNGLGVNILSTHTFLVVGIPMTRLFPSDIVLNTFQIEFVATRGFVNVVLEVGPIKTMNTFNVGNNKIQKPKVVYASLFDEMAPLGNNKIQKPKVVRLSMQKEETLGNQRQTTERPTKKTHSEGGGIIREALPNSLTRWRIL